MIGNFYFIRRILKMQQSHQYPKFPQKEQNFTKHVIGDVSFLLL